MNEDFYLHMPVGMTKKFLNSRGRPYYRRIILSLFIFLSAVMVPFVLAFYQKAEKNIMNSINRSNETVMQQMKYNYTYFSENMSALCLSTFFRSDVKLLMYSGEVDYNEVYHTIRDLRNNILETQPSVQSIEIYNAKRNEWYTTDISSAIVKGGKTDGIQIAERIYKLCPLLRKKYVNEEMPDVFNYVFSYYMYEYADPTVGDNSYIVLNQNASWFIDNITDVNSHEKKAEVFLTDKEGTIYNYKEIEIQERYHALITECLWEHVEDSSDKGFYIDEYKNEKYLISYLNLGDRGNYVVMIESYDTVFFDLIQMKYSFIAFSLICGVISIIGMIFLSKNLYRPVNTLMDCISSLDAADGKREIIYGDEFTHLRDLYRSIHFKTQKLVLENRNTRSVIKRYALMTLLNDSTKASWESYYKSMPNASLSLCEDYRLMVMSLRLDEVAPNGKKALKSNGALMLFAMDNVFSELMESICDMESLQAGETEMVYIINLREPSVSLENIKGRVVRMQEFMKMYFNQMISGSYSEISTDQTMLSELYEKAQYYDKYHIVKETGSLLGYPECADNINNGDSSYPRKTGKKLEENLKLGNMEQIEETLSQIKNTISAFSYENIIINTITMLITINTVIDELKTSVNSPSGIHFNQMVGNVLNMESLDGLFAEILDSIRSVFCNTYQVRKKEDAWNRLFLETVKDYVLQNYSDRNLTSQSIASYMNLSGRYLMRKFKQCMGISLNEYILGIRMDRAVSFLLNTDMPVHKIAENIGIDNENYFYRLFKKTYGCTPREFNIK